MTRFVRGAPAVTALLVINVVMLLVAETLGGSTNLRVMFDLGALPNPLPSGNLWRLVTSMFLHFGVLHLAFNMFALWLFGPLFERLVGTGRFLALYFASGLAGGLASVLFATPPTLSAGASGAIFGLLGAFGVLGFRLRHTAAGNLWLRQAGALVGVNVVIGLVEPSIGLEAHLGGLAGGVIVLGAETAGLGRLTGPSRLRIGRRAPTPRRWYGLGAAAAVGVASVATVAQQAG